MSANIDDVKKNVRTLAVGRAERTAFRHGVNKACEMLNAGKTPTEVVAAAPRDSAEGEGMRAVAAYVTSLQPQVQELSGPPEDEE